MPPYLWQNNGNTSELPGHSLSLRYESAARNLPYAPNSRDMRPKRLHGIARHLVHIPILHGVRLAGIPPSGGPAHDNCRGTGH